MDISPIIISIQTSIVAILITAILGILIAKFVVSLKNYKLKIVIDSILTLPLVLPPTVVGFILLLIFGVKRPIGMFFLEVFNYRIAFSWSATVIAAIVVSFPLMYRATRSALEQIDSSYIECAKTLGLSKKKIFLKIQLPLALPGIMAGTIMAFARGLGEFGATTMLAGNINGETQTLPLAIYSKVASNEFNQAYNYVIIILIISFVIVALMNWFNASKSSY